MYQLYSALINIPQNYIVFAGSIVLLGVIIAVFAEYSTEGATSRQPERIYIQEIRGDSLREEINDYIRASDMPPNTSAFFYYPDSKDTANRDVYQLFQLIRLPVFLGGGEEISTYRAYSAVDLSSHCVTKYWSQEERMRIEDPCGGNMYNPLNGALLTVSGNPVFVEKNSALPYLELTTDDEGYILVKPPTWTKEKNGAIGIGGTVSLQEKERYEEIVQNYKNTLEEKLNNIELPQTLATGHKYADLNRLDMTKRTAIYKDPDGGSTVNISYEWCNCTRQISQIESENPRPYSKILSFGDSQVYAYPNHVNTISGEHTQYTFVFYQNGFYFKVKTWMDFETGSNLIKNVFFS